MIAALPMYDWPEIRAANDAFWAAAAARLWAVGVPAPGSLTRDREPEAIWTDPELLLAQTCGLPLVTGRCGDAAVVARGDYGVEGAGDGLYSSAVICRRGEARPLDRFRGARVAINGYGSQSGCNALADMLPESEFFGSVTVSGSHRASARMVANGEADMAAIDAVSWSLFRNHEPDAAELLDVVAWTRMTPSLPFIVGPAWTARQADVVAALAGAADGRVHGLPAAVRPAGAADYDAIRDMVRRLRNRRLAPGEPAVA